MSITGERDGRPIKPGPTIGDTGTGMLLAFSIVSALFERTRTGKGRTAAGGDAGFGHALQPRHVHHPGADRRSGAAAAGRPTTRPAASIPCQPGGPNDYVYLLTSRANPEHWPRLLKLIGREDLIGDPRYDTPDARLECEAEVDEIVSAWTRQRTKHEAMTQLSAVGVPAGAVLDSHGTDQRAELPAARHPANHDAWRTEDDDAHLAGALRRRPGRSQVGAIAGRAHRGSAGRLARTRCGRGRGLASRRHRLRRTRSRHEPRRQAAAAISSRRAVASIKRATCLTSIR